MAVNKDIVDGIIAGLESMPKKSEIDTPTNNIDQLASQTEDGLMSSDDKKKLDGIATDANKYIHPTTSGNKHIPSGGSDGQILKWDSDGAAKWANEFTYGYASSSSGGLMSSTDKTNLDAAVTKLNNIADGANNYTLPVASNTILGGVKTTSNVSDTSDYTPCPIVNGVPYYMNTVGSYTLPVASNTTLGGVKTTSEVSSTSGYTPCPIIAGVPYYKGELYGFEYNEEAKKLVYGTDPTTVLNQGIGLDDTLSKKGFAADSAAVGEIIGDISTILSNVLGVIE